MRPVVAGLGLALLASVALNGSFLLQHVGSASTEAITPAHPLRAFRALLSAPLWTIGGALGTLGWGLHVLALTKAPLSLVQAFVAGGVALTVPAARWWLRRPISRREVGCVLALAAGLAILGTGVVGAGRGLAFSDVALAAFLGTTAAGAAALAGAGVRRERPLLLAAAGGLFYGGADLAIKVLTGVFAAGGLAGALRSPWLAVAVGLTVPAFFAFQRSLQAGRAVPAIALMTAGTYVVSIGGGLAILGDRLGHSTLGTTLHAAALVVVVLAACGLAGSQAQLALEAVPARGAPAAR